MHVLTIEENVCHVNHSFLKLNLILCKKLKKKNENDIFLMKIKILWSLKSERGLHYKRNRFPRFQTLIDYRAICQKLGEDIRIPKLSATVF